MRGWLLVLAACKAAPAPAPTIANRAEGPPRFESDLEACSVEGQVVDGTTGEPLIGATLVVDNSQGDQTFAIADEDGRFTLVKHGGLAKLQIYYLDAVNSRHLHDRDCGGPLDLVFDSSQVTPGPIVVH